jgi:hypothetical protein
VGERRADEYAGEGAKPGMDSRSGGNVKAINWEVTTRLAIPDARDVEQVRDRFSAAADYAVGAPVSRRRLPVRRDLELSSRDWRCGRTGCARL